MRQVVDRIAVTQKQTSTGGAESGEQIVNQVGPAVIVAN
jgi:hypothetical protein